MRRSKLILLIAGIIFALLALVAGLALTPGVQTWAVRRALAGQTGMKAEVGRVAAGLSSLELRNVRVEQGGIVIVAKDVTATYSATDYLFGHRITVGSVALRGVEVDARKPTATAAPASTAALAPFAGILSSVRLPGDVRLGTIKMEAKLLLPDSQTATFRLDGGGMAPGATATIKWTSAFADPRPTAALATLQGSGEMKLHTTTDQRFDAIEVTGEVGATGPHLPTDRARLELKLAQASPTAGETIAAKVSLVRGAAIEPLLQTSVAFTAGKPVLAGTWNVTVRSEQFAAVLADFGLPEISLAGDGAFTYDLGLGTATASGTLNSQVSHLEKLGAELAAIGALRVHAAFDAGGSRVSAQLAKLEFEIATSDGRKLVAATAEQKLTFDFKNQRLTPELPGAELARVSLLSVPLAWAQPWVKPRVIDGGDVSGEFVVEAELDGSKVRTHATKPLVIRSATLREGAKLLLDRVTLSVSPNLDYTAGRSPVGQPGTPARVVAEVQNLSVSSPDGDALTGSLSADVALGAKPATAFTAQLQGRLTTLVKPYLPAAGPLVVTVSTKGRLEGNELQLATLKAQVDREGGAVLAAVEALQPLSLDLEPLKVRAGNAAAPAARVRWGELPLAWAEPYVAQMKISGLLAGGTLDVSLPGGEAIAVRVGEKISARGVTLSLEGQEQLRDADLATDLNATWKAGTLTADVRQLEIRQGKVALLTGAVAGDVTPGKTLRASGHGSLAVDFASLVKQPSLASRLPVVSGSANVKFDGAVADGVRGKLEIVADNLVARQGALPLGKLELTVETNLDARNSGTVRVPLVLTKDGRRSDLLLEGKVGLKPDALSFEGRVTSTEITVDDLQAFNALNAEPPPSPPVMATAPAAPRPAVPLPAAKTTSATPVRDPSPVWAGFAGRIEVDLKSVKQGPGTTLQNLRGTLAATADRFTIENVAGKLNGNPFKISTVLGFDLKQARPYTLVGSLDVPGFDVGAFLRAADPGTPPPLETTFTVTSSLKGTGANLADLADHLTGKFDFKGSKGVLRALNRKAEAASLVTGLLGLAMKSNNLMATSELVGALRDITFDSLTMHLERNDQQALRLTSLELLSPRLRLTGTGSVDHKPGTPFADSPLEVRLLLAAKDNLASLMNQARLLGGKTDDRGYYSMQSPFVLSGTAGKPDASALWGIILKSGANFLAP